MSDDIQVLGPEHEECVIAYGLLRQELVKRTAERDEARHAYELKIQDFARETARVSRALAACDRSIHSAAYKASPVGEAGLGWLAAQEYIEAAIGADPAEPSPGPRVWKKGDPEPDWDVLEVTDRSGKSWRRTGNVRSIWFSDDAPGVWGFTKLLDVVGPLTEVIQDGSYPDGGADA